MARKRNIWTQVTSRKAILDFVVGKTVTNFFEGELTSGWGIDIPKDRSGDAAITVFEDGSAIACVSGMIWGSSCPTCGYNDEAWVGYYTTNRVNHDPCT